MRKNKRNKEADTTEDSKFGLKTQFVQSGSRIEKLNSFKIVPFSIAALIALSGGIIFSSVYNFQLNDNRQKVNYVADLKQMSERIEKSSLQARTGNAYAFEELKSSEQIINNILGVLKYGGKIEEGDIHISPIDNNLSIKFNQVISEWENNKPLLNALINQEANIVKLKNDVFTQREKIQTIIDSTANIKKLMQRESYDLVTYNYAQELLLLINRINQGMSELFSSETFSLESGYLLVKDIRQFEYIINLLEKGSNVYGIQPLKGAALVELNSLKQQFSSIYILSGEIVKQVSTLNNAKDVALQVSNSSRDLVATATELDNDFIKNINALDKYLYLAILSFIILFALIAFIAAIFFERSKRAARAAKELQKNQNNQAAVNLLLQQIEPLSNGDFTHRVYVPDRFVTQIAKKVDLTRETFAEIVKKIKITSKSIGDSADKTDASSKRLLEVSNDQFGQMESFIEKISQITSEMDEISQITWFAEQNSMLSHSSSKEGEHLVRKSIEKMNEIRNNIQESAKKIKKSSESAQAITDVIELIQNITKQIEVLSLNAAIQAASSGEAGKEFAIVAQEVKRLAIDSKEATEQILHLVSDVKEDINVAIYSMETTTQEVVEGAKLTDAAGQALQKIDEISKSVADNISQASKKLEEKSEDMTKISLDMRDLQSTTENSKEIVNTTAHQVEDLKKISQELINTIKDYKVQR